MTDVCPVTAARCHNPLCAHWCRYGVVELQKRLADADRNCTNDDAPELTYGNIARDALAILSGAERRADTPPSSATKGQGEKV